MFSSFFPKPKFFFPAVVLWTALSMALWYGAARDLGPQLSIGGLIGFAYPPANADGAAVAVETARNIWLYQYMIGTGAHLRRAGRLAPAAPLVPLVGAACSALIVFLIWFHVQLDVMINNWFGTFYNMVQQALAKPGAITEEQFFGQLATFGAIAHRLHHDRRAERLHHQPLRLPLAHGDERLLRRQLASSAAHRGRLAAHPGGYAEIRHDR